MKTWIRKRINEVLKRREEGKKRRKYQYAKKILREIAK